MAFVPYWCKLHHGTGVAVRAFLNDVLFYRHDGSENYTLTAPANHFFVPGENALRVELAATVAPAFAPRLRGPIDVRVMRDAPGNPVVAACRWTWTNYHAEPPLPEVLHARFTPEGDVVELAFVRAPSVLFGREGTPEQRAAVRRIHDAFSRGDLDAFFEESRFKLIERQLAYPGNDAFDLGFLRRKLVDNFARRWSTRPLDLDALVFESQAGGRVAYVTRADGGRALAAVTVDGLGPPTLSMDADLWLTQVDGVWRLFR